MNVCLFLPANLYCYGGQIGTVDSIIALDFSYT
jgi:hypothetical protein